MRKTVVCNIMSLDSKFEGPGENVMALNMDHAFDAWNLERIRNAGTVLLGRTSYEMFGSFWPAVADAPIDPGNPGLSDVNREFSRIYNRIPKAVVSDSYTPPAGHPWRETTTVVARSELDQWLAVERQRSSGDIVVFGSHVLWNHMLQRGLVDELNLIVSPKTFGGGTPVFTGVAALEPMEARWLNGSDNLLLRYRPNESRR